MPTRKNHIDRVKKRKEKVDKRAEARDALGDVGQLARLEKANLSHTKEAARLRNKITKD